MFFRVLEKFGCAPAFLHLIKALHSNNTATGCVRGELSEASEVTMGVKKGCVLAPILSNVFLLDVKVFTTNGISWPNTGTDGGTDVS